MKQRHRGISQQIAMALQEIGAMGDAHKVRAMVRVRVWVWVTVRAGLDESGSHN